MYALDISDNECRDAKFRVSTRVSGYAYLIYGDVYLLESGYIFFQSALSEYCEVFHFDARTPIQYSS